MPQQTRSFPNCHPQSVARLWPRCRGSDVACCYYAAAVLRCRWGTCPWSMLFVVLPKCLVCLCCSGVLDVCLCARVSVRRACAAVRCRELSRKRASLNTKISRNKFSVDHRSLKMRHFEMPSERKCEVGSWGSYCVETCSQM
jgi:hypothetical protein